MSLLSPLQVQAADAFMFSFLCFYGRMARCVVLQHSPINVFELLRLLCQVEVLAHILPSCGTHATPEVFIGQQNLQIVRKSIRITLWGEESRLPVKHCLSHSVSIKTCNRKPH